MITRKNQKDFTENEWVNFTAAVRAIQDINATSPNYSALARIHTPVFHQRTAHRFPTFLPWHREYLWVFESRLRQENPNVTLPYWNWLEDRKIPSKLSKASDWGVTRGMDADDLVDDYTLEVNDAVNETTFRRFHSFMNGPHGGIHINVGA